MLLLMLFLFLCVGMIFIYQQRRINGLECDIESLQYAVVEMEKSVKEVD